MSLEEAKPHLNTTGSRSKKIVVKPESDDEYFFKGSKELSTGEIRYPMEFWSEIVSSKIGQYLGFNMLDYNIAYNSRFNQKIGCISKSMVEHSENRLTEGISYLTGFDSAYNPEKDKGKYTFSFISKALKQYKLQKHMASFVEMLIFDALISNSDRHQENWGFIVNYHVLLNTLENETKKRSGGFFVQILYSLFRFVVHHLPKHSELPKRYLKAQSELAPHGFSPIYDSGCCLGREIEDGKIGNYLVDNQMLESYVSKGSSEIRWEISKKKKSHFELIKHLKSDYPDIINNVLERLRKKFKEEEIKEIIGNIDSNLPSNLSKYKLAENRKELMIKILTLRSQKLQELY